MFRKRAPGAPDALGRPGGRFPTPLEALLLGTFCAGAVVLVDVLLELQHGTDPLPLREFAPALVGYVATVATVSAFLVWVVGWVGSLGGNAGSPRLRRRSEASIPLLLTLGILSLPLAWRISDLLFLGGKMRAWRWGGVAPVVFCALLVVGLGLLGLAVRRIARGSFGVMWGMGFGVAAALTFWMDRTLYPNLYGYLHEGLVVATHVLLLVSGALLLGPIIRSGPWRRAVGGRWAWFGGVLLMILFGIQAWRHLSTFGGESNRVRRMVSERLQTPRRLQSLLPYAVALDVEDPVAGESAAWRRERDRCDRALKVLEEVRPKTPLNVLILSVDAVRRDHCSLYGYGRTTTPFLQRFGEEAFVFEKAWAPSTTSFWTLIPMLDGTHPATMIEDRLHACDNLPRAASRAGYRTRGWFAPTIFTMRPSGWPPFDPALGFDEVTPETRATEVIDEILAGLDGPGPFLYWAHIMDPHDPYVERGGNFGTEPRDRYDSEILHVDRELQRLWEGLCDRGLAESTVVVVTSDHGEGFGEHGGYYHGGIPWEEQCRVPLLIRVPYLADRAGRLHGPVGLSSVAPTVQELAGLPPLEDNLSLSLTPLMLGLSDGSERRVIIERPFMDQFPTMNPVRAITDGRFKLVRDLKRNLLSLYDLESDPGELHDLADTHAEHVGRLQQDLRQVNADVWHALEVRSQEAAAFPPGYTQARRAIRSQDLRELGAFRQWLIHRDPELRGDAARLLYDVESRQEEGGWTSWLLPTGEKGWGDPLVAAYADALRLRRGAGGVTAPILLALQHSDPRVRVRMVQALAAGADQVTDARSMEALWAQESVPSVRRAWALFFGWKKDRRSLEDLFQMAGEAEGPDREQALRTLWRFADEQVFDPLLDLARAQDQRFTSALIDSMNATTDARRKLLRDVLRSATSPWTRCSAVSTARGLAEDPSLGEEHRQVGRDLLLAAIRWDSDPVVVEHAARKTRGLTGPDLSAALLESIGSHPGSAAVLAQALFGVRNGEPTVSPEGILLQVDHAIGKEPRPVILPDVLEIAPAARRGFVVAAGLRVQGDAGSQPADVLLIDAAGIELGRVPVNPSLPFVLVTHIGDVGALTWPLQARVDGGGPTCTVQAFALAVVPRRDPLRSLGVSFTDPTAPYQEQRFSPDWVLSSEFAELTDGDGTFRWWQEDRLLERVQVVLETSGSPGRWIFQLNGVTLWEHELPPGLQQWDLPVPESAQRPFGPNILRFRRTTAASEAHGSLGLVSLTGVESGRLATRDGTPSGLRAMAGDPTGWLPEQGPLRFFVAGHVYGRHELVTKGLFHPFRAAMNGRLEHDPPHFLILTGDAVFEPRGDFFAELDADLDALGWPTFLAPGNHDSRAEQDLVQARYGRRSLAFRHGDYGFIVGDSVRGGGNLSSQDVERLRALLSGGVRAVFVFVHHLVWLDKAGAASGGQPRGLANSLEAGYAEEGTWSQHVLPLLAEARVPVFVFAGDVGAGSKVVASYQQALPHVHLVTSGMGDHPSVGTWLEVEAAADAVTIQTHALGPGQGDLPDGVSTIPSSPFPIGRR